MGESSDEVWSAPITPRLPTSVAPTPPIVSCPPSQYHSPSMSRSPLLTMGDHPRGAASAPFRTPKSRTPRFITPLITPLGSPLRKALKMTKLDPQDAWLPITQSRNGNAYYAAFHTLCSGIGIQALVLPVAFTVLGWAWGIICLTVAFIWQLYTLYVMVQLHENAESEVRYCRYMQLANATFGERLAKLFAAFPIMYLSAGTCTTLIIIGGSTSKMLYQTLCGATCTSKPLTNVEWYLVFTCAAVLLSQLPNLNSIAGVSLLGSLTAIAYCTLIWAVSVAEGRLPNVSYDPLRKGKQIERIFDVLNALGIIAFAFRGHNLVLEIQIGELAGLAVGATVLLNVMFAGPISGASMNPARSLGPAIVSKKYTGIWIYLLGPTAGAIAGAWVYNTIRFTDKPLREITKSGSFLRSKGSGSRNGSK